MEEYRELKLEADTFEKLRIDANYVLQRALGTMKEKESMEGKVTISLDIKLMPEFIPNFDPEVEGETRKILKPRFEHKISSAINIKNEKKGNTEPEMAMEWDEEAQSYVLKYINNTDQRSMFDPDFQNMMRDREEENSEGFMNVPMLEGEVADRCTLAGPVMDESVLSGPVIDETDIVDDGYGYEDVV